MKTETLLDIIRATDAEPFAYSGRGMYGKRCVAFSFDGSVMGAVADLIEGAGAIMDTGDEVSELADALRSAATDDLGRGTVLYFPRVAWVEGAE